MKRFLMTALLAVSLSGTAVAETIHVGVNGLVCAFCVKGIEKSFGKAEAVETVHVDLDEKLVTLVTKPDHNIDDATITTTIVDAGYNVTTIHRMK